MYRIGSLIFLLLINASNAFAVTQFTVTVNKSGNDYSTLQTAESALDDAGNITDGTVKCGSWDGCSGTCDASNMIDAEAVTWDAGASTGTLIHLTSTQYMIDVTGGSLADNDTINDGDGNTFNINGTPDSCIVKIEAHKDNGTLTAGVDIDGWTTNSTNYIILTAGSGSQHGMVAGAGVVIDPSSNITNGNGVIHINEGNVVVEWMEIKGFEVAFSGTVRGIMGNLSSANAIIRNNIIHDSDNGDVARTYQGIAITRQYIIENNLVYNMGDEGITQIDSFGTTIYVDNNTVYNYNENNQSKTGLSVAGGATSYNRNNLVIAGANGGACFTCDADYTQSNNASSDTSACGTSTQTSVTASQEFWSVTAGTEDFRLKSGAKSADNGVDIGTTNGVNIDARNFDRDASGDVWSIGAYEYVNGRLWSSGFELQSSVSGIEVDNITTVQVSVDTTTKRSGAASLKTNPTTFPSIIRQKVRTASTTGIYGREYIYIESLNTISETRIMSFSSNSIERIGLYLQTDGTVDVKVSGGSTYGGTTVLSTGTWYRIELYTDPSSTTFNFRINGTQESTGTSASGNIDEFSAENSLTVTNGIIYFDDIAVNDVNGTYQNTWPGEGKIIHLRPNATGDFDEGTASSGTSSSVLDEITPDDTTTEYEIQLDAERVDVNIDASTTPGIGSSDTINVVSAGLRVRGDTSGACSMRARLKSQASGTILNGSTIDSTTTSYFTHKQASTGKNYTLTSYLEPQAYGVWTPTLLNGSQIGMEAIDAAPNVFVTTAWLLVDYTEYVAPSTRRIFSVN